MNIIVYVHTNFENFVFLTCLLGKREEFLTVKVNEAYEMTWPIV